MSTARPTRSRPPNAGPWLLHRRDASFAIGVDPTSPCRCCGVSRSADNRSAHGAYVLAEAEGGRQATLLATGSEVSIAMMARAGARQGRHPSRGCVDAVLGIVRGRASRKYRDRGSRHGAPGRRSRLPSVSAGIAGSGSTAPLSACSALARRPQARRSILHFGDYARKGCRGRPLASIDWRKAFSGGASHGCAGCNQRFRPHRPPRLARGLRA